MLQRRYEKKSQRWRAQSCKTRSFLSWDTCRGCGQQRDVKHDEYINEWSQTVAWPQQGGDPPEILLYPVNKPKGAAQALALARQQLAQAKAAALPNEVHKEEAAMKHAQLLRQKMDQVRARFRRAVESGEKAMQALQKAQETSEQAQQEVMQAQTDLEMLMQEAPLPVMPVPQVNVSLVKTLEALTGVIENL